MQTVIHSLRDGILKILFRAVGPVKEREVEKENVIIIGVVVLIVTAGDAF